MLSESTLANLIAGHDSHAAEARKADIQKRRVATRRANDAKKKAEAEEAERVAAEDARRKQSLERFEVERRKTQALADARKRHDEARTEQSKQGQLDCQEWLSSAEYAIAHQMMDWSTRISSTVINTGLVGAFREKIGEGFKPPQGVHLSIAAAYTGGWIIALQQAHRVLIEALRQRNAAKAKEATA